MKTCPKCNRTYQDESLSFCLDDGTPLTTVSEQNQQYDPQATLFMAPSDLQTSQVESRTTSDSPHESQPPQSQTPFSQQPTQYSSAPYSQQSTPQQSSPFAPAVSTQQSSYQTPPPTWNPPISQQAQPKKRSFLPWVIAGIGLVVVGGLGLVIVVAIIASMSTNDNENNSNNTKNENRIVVNTNNSNNKNTNNANNTINTNNSNSSTNDATNPSFITNTYLAANSQQGTRKTVFSSRDKIYFVYTVEDTPRALTVVCNLVYDTVSGYKPVSATDRLNAGYSGSPSFFFTPGSSGWPAGSYHIELLEKKSDGSLEKLTHIALTVE